MENFFVTLRLCEKINLRVKQPQTMTIPDFFLFWIEVGPYITKY